jgi:hypothetical protein
MTRGPAMGDRQAGEVYGDPTAADVENPTGVIAADGQAAGARADDAQAVGDVQFAAR